MGDIAFETGHYDLIHDAQLDYYGRRLATASSDRLIKIFDVSGETQTHVCDISGHEGPVWRVSWAHPKFGSLLASCSYDQRVIIWREEPVGSGQWMKMYEKVFDSSVNSVSWAPHEFGLSLAVGSSDGRIAVISYQENAWRENVFEGHTGGVNAVSWAPAVAAGSIFGGSSTKVDSPVRFASGGCDGRVKIWKHDNGSWFEELYLVDQKSAQSKWIRDVAWAPSIGMSTSTIASSGDDQSVVIWTEKPGSQGEWLAMEKLVFDQKVWRLAWSVMGNILAISHGDGAENRVSLWKETLDGKWKNLSSMDEAQALNQTESE